MPIYDPQQVTCPALNRMSFAVIAVSFVIVSLVIWYIQWKYSYWKKKKLPCVTPTFPFGNIENPLRMKYQFDIWIKKLYGDFKARGEKYAGIYLFTKPVYLPIDPEMIKAVMQKDFDHFVDRGFYYNEKEDPLSAHLFAIGGTKWRSLRTKLTPTFTSGKMKNMFGTLLECKKGMLDFVEEKCAKGEAVDMKNVLERFTIDIIGSCAFGIDCNSFKTTDSEFQKYGLEVLRAKSSVETLKNLFAVSKPNLARSLGMTITPEGVTKFFMNVVKDTVNYRETNKFRRNDMLQILIDLRNGNETQLKLTEIAAQAFIFFLGGFETSSSTMSFCLYELSQNQVLQNKVRNEITSVLAKHGNQITYDAIMDMKYMQQLIDETLRKYPIIATLTRECVKDYRIPQTSTLIDKGVMVMISVLGLHHDPEYFEDPEKFDPERFSDENKQNITPFTYLPFGEGPRLCIGMRFGLMQTKLGLTTLLRDYKFTLNEKTIIPLVWDKFCFVLKPETPIWLNVEKIE